MNDKIRIGVHADLQSSSPTISAIDVPDSLAFQCPKKLS
jgi:hypothetical protein